MLLFSFARIVLIKMLICMILPEIANGSGASELIGDDDGVAASAGYRVSDELDEDSHRHFTDTIPGDPNADYPTYESIPKTAFSCIGRPNWGYYADVEAGCQVFHVCESDYSKISFLCPIGSIFNQRHLVCDWWYNYECNDLIDVYTVDFHATQDDGAEESNDDFKQSYNDEESSQNKKNNFNSKPTIRRKQN